MKISRRVVGRMILGAPVAFGATLAGALGRVARADEPQKPAEAGSPPEPEPTPLAKFLAKQEDGLSGDERAKVRKDITQLEDALKQVRDFPIGNDVPPAGGFRPIRSVRKGR
ncbi:MAG TPA: hypothetical protein VFQ07_01210 [Candidatus Polarisedimenticolia bacterium]|nr:hypothetical protein [Candidatus Polarisedimenticolia bacterium]